MKQRLVIAGVVVVVLLVGWLAWTQVSDSGGGGGGSQPQGVSVVDRINSETDCTVLQGEFDQAQTNQRTDWMRVADARMRAMECYGR